MTLVSGIKLFLDFRKRSSEYCHQNWSGVVEIDEFAVFPITYLREFPKTIMTKITL